MSYSTDGMIDPRFQEQTGLLLQNESGKVYFCNLGESLRCLLVFLCPILNVNRNDYKQRKADLLGIQTLRE